MSDERGEKSMSPRMLFEQELNRLKEDLKRMGFEVADSYERLFRAVENRDKETIAGAARGDNGIKEMERSIEASCLSLITRQQPVARDLRVVAAGLKVVTDLERVGNHVADIAGLIVRLGVEDSTVYPAHFSAMAQAAGEMLKESVEAFASRDKKAAEEAAAKDDVVDGLFNKVKAELIDCLRTGTRSADECVDMLMIAKYLEKIGDHAESIAEWEAFQETGNIRDIRLL